MSISPLQFHRRDIDATLPTKPITTNTYLIHQTRGNPIKSRHRRLLIILLQASIRFSNRYNYILCSVDNFETGYSNLEGLSLFLSGSAHTLKSAHILDDLIFDLIFIEILQSTHFKKEL